MTPHNRNQETTDAARNKFPEPQGWAMQWDGSSHAIAAQQDPAAGGQETEDADGSWNPFPEPSGWAAKWDGHVLSQMQSRQNGRFPEGSS